MSFTQPPVAPSSTDPVNFDTRADAFMAWFQTAWLELNEAYPVIAGASSSALAAAASASTAIGAGNYASTCTTSIALSTGAKTITAGQMQTGKSFPTASNFAVVFVRQADASVRLSGVLNPYNPGNGSATFTVTAFTGAGGPYSDWICIAAAFMPPLASTAQVQQGTDPLALLTVKALYDASAPQTLVDASTINWDMAAGWNAKVTLAGNRTIAQPIGYRKGITYVLEVIQDSATSRLLSWNGCFDFGLVGAPNLAIGAGKRDVIYLYCYDDSLTTPKFRGSYSKGA